LWSFVDAFRVICETCRSRLKVRSAEAIGEIHACPKCGSMVQIVRPADWAGHAAAPAAAAGLATSAIEPALTLSPSMSAIIPADFATELPVETFAVSIPQAAAAALTPIAPAEAAISPVVWWAVGGAAAFVVAGLTFVLWPSGGGERNPASAATTDVATPAEPSPVAQDPYAVDQSKDDSNQSPPTGPAEPVEQASMAVVETAPADDAQVTAASPPRAAASAPPATETPAPKVEPTATVAAATPAVPTGRADAASSNAGAGTPEQVLKFDPLDFDPEHLSLSSKPSTGSTPPPPATSTTSVPAELPVEVVPAAKDAEADKIALASDILPPPAANRAVNVRRGPTAGDESRPLDTAQHLAAQLKSFQVTEVPLARFVETLSDLAGVPITLDPVTLELNGLSPRTPITALATDATLETILRDAFTKQRLELVEEDGRLGIELSNADEQRAVDFEVKDLVSGADAAPIGKLVEQFVALQTWKSRGGKGTIEVQGTNLHIDQSLTVRREALIFCERLRLARGLPLRSKYPPALLATDSPYHKAAAKLGEPTTFTFLAWTRLGDVVRQWQEMSGFVILVDWRALREVEFGPTSPLACSAVDRPWTEALDGVLNPLGLGWWATDAQTIQITSLDALSRIERVEFYAVPKVLRDASASDQALVESLRRDIDGRAVKIGGTGDVRIELDKPSGRLIVLGTPDVHRFLSGRLAAAK
jgi:hypothetical protein